MHHNEAFAAKLLHELFNWNSLTFANRAYTWCWHIFATFEKKCTSFES